MQTMIRRLDDLAGIDSDSAAVAWMERVAFIFLVLMIISSPHSIAATQTAWITGMFIWIVRLFFKPRVKFRFTALDIALWAFFVWSIITSLTSYAPDISINKLRGAAVFLIFYFVLYNTRSRRAAHFLAFTLIASCMVNVLWTPVQRLIGRGVEIHGLAPNGPLARAVLAEGDTLLEANGKKIVTPEDLLAAMQQNDVTKVKFYRPDFDFVVDVKRAELLTGPDAMSQLGFSSWKKSRNWRSSGFYGHYATYSEVLQLIASLVFGLLVALFGTRTLAKEGGKGSEGEGETRAVQDSTTGRRTISPSPLLPVSLAPLLPFSLSPFLLLTSCVAAMSVALLLTVTRASQLAFLISCGAIVLFGLGRKWLVAATAIALPIALVGLLFLQQSRQVGFFDQTDTSTTWRQTIWREGFELWIASPRHFLLGVGMDSIKRYAPDWHLFDDGRLPMGHFHSTPLNLVVERGLPALLLWISVLAIYARSLWRNLKSKIENPKSRGILLGCLGGTIGFFISGFVHYNLGDQEVAMMFFLLMGLGIRTADQISSVDSG
jgi:O-antigen ligase